MQTNIKGGLIIKQFYSIEPKHNLMASNRKLEQVEYDINTLIYGEAEMLVDENLPDDKYELWDYPLTEIDHIVENELNVVLVDCSHYEGDVYVNEYRWFEVSEGFSEDDEDEEE